MAEGEIIGFGASSHREERDDVSTRGWFRCGEGEVSADDGYECGDGDKCVEVPVLDGAICVSIGDAGTCAFGAVENAADQQGESRQCGKAVVLLAIGEGEEAQDKECPEEKREGSFVFACGGCGLVEESANLFGDRGGEEDGPGHDPEDEIEPEEPDGGEAVVVGDAFGEEAGDVLSL